MLGAFHQGGRGQLGQSRHREGRGEDTSEGIRMQVTAFLLPVALGGLPRLRFSLHLSPFL